MITGAINEMLLCEDPSALQVILVSAGTFDAFVSLLQKTSVSCKLIVLSLLPLSLLNFLNGIFHLPFWNSPLL